MSHWWRTYDEAVDDPKLQLLPAPLFKAWFNLMCIASANGGKLPAAAAIAFKLRTTETKVKQIIAELVERHLLDERDGGYAPHNWGDRQYTSDSSAALRQRRYRERHRNATGDGDSNVTVTVQDTDTDTDTESSVPKGTGANAPSGDPKTEFFRRGREVLGKSSGALLAKLLRSFGPEDDPKSIAKARARIEEASTKAKPVEWVGRVMAPKDGEFKLMSGMEGIV